MAVGKHLRWSDLCMLKDDWEEKEKTDQSQEKGQDVESDGQESEDDTDRSYRVCASGFPYFNAGNRN